LARLSERYEGEWVAVLDTGDLVSDKDPKAVFAEAKGENKWVTLVRNAGHVWTLNRSEKPPCVADIPLRTNRTIK